MNITNACPNCGNIQIEKFCSHCGQPQNGQGNTFRELLFEFFNELTDVDGRLLLTLRTILFEPGCITKDYAAQRRMRYLPPFRMYLLANVVLYFVLGWFSSGVNVRLDNISVDLVLTGDQIYVTDEPSRIIQNSDDGKINRAIYLNNKESLELLASHIPQLGFVLLPVAALILMLLFFRRKLPFGIHFVAALHIKTAIALILSIAAILNGVCTVIQYLLGVPLLVISKYLLFTAVFTAIVHVAFTVHGIYGGKIVFNLLRIPVLFFTYAYAATAGMFVLVMYTAWSMANA